MHRRGSSPKEAGEDELAVLLDAPPTRSTQSLSVRAAASERDDKPTMKLSSIMESPVELWQDTPPKNVQMNNLKSNDILDQQRFDEVYGFRRVDQTLGKRAQWNYRKVVRWRRSEWCDFVMSRVPILRWLTAYKWKSDFLLDMVTGLMVSVMTVPQSLAYGYLVGVPPIYGLVTSVVGPFIYSLFGSSRHVSPGSFAIVSLMVGAVVDRFASEGSPELPDTLTLAQQAEQLCCLKKRPHINEQDAINAAATVTVLIGIFQIIFGLMNAGLLAVWLSDHLVQGLTTGAAIHVLTSQLHSMTGISSVPPTSGPFTLIKFYVCFSAHIQDVHVPSATLSLISVVLLLTSAYVIDPIFRKWCIFKFPMELILVIFSTLLVYLSEGTEYEIRVPIVGPVNSGFPTPLLPPMANAADMMGPAVAIAVISFVIHISLCKLVSKKHHYEVDSNQEWLALGIMHTFSSFFGCFAGGSSLGRTMMAEKCGSKTQLSTIFACAVLLGFVFGAARFIFYLPKAVLASIVVVALKDLFLQLIDSLKVAKKSMFDLLILVVTLSAVVILDVSYGLLVGVSFALLTVIFRTQWAECMCLGRIPGTSHFRGMGYYTKTVEIPGLKIFRFDSPLFFANSELFIKLVHKNCVNPIIVRAKIQEQENKKKAKEKTLKRSRSSSSASDVTPVTNGNTVRKEISSEAAEVDEHEITEITHIIIDCSSISFVDMMGKDALMQTYLDYKAIEISVLFAATKEMVRVLLSTTDFAEKVPKSRLVVSLSDAVKQALWEQQNKFPINSPSSREHRRMVAEPVAKSVTQKTKPFEPDEQIQMTQSPASLHTGTDHSFVEKPLLQQKNKDREAAKRNANSRRRHAKTGLFGKTRSRTNNGFEELEDRTQ